MKTKLTLRVDQSLVRKAKHAAAIRDKSVSLMFSEYIELISADSDMDGKLPPVTASLKGVLKNNKLSEADYKRHLSEKYG